MTKIKKPRRISRTVRRANLVMSLVDRSTREISSSDGSRTSRAETSAVASIRRAAAGGPVSVSDSREGDS
jgi:hypothetical protein